MSNTNLPAGVQTADEIAAYAADLHASFGCLQSTIDLYDKAIALRPMRAEFYVGRAFLYMYARKDSQALGDVDRAQALNPALLLSSYIRSTVLFDMTRKTQTASGRSYHNRHDADLRRQACASFDASEFQFRSRFPTQDLTHIEPRVLLGRLYALRRMGSRADALDFLDRLLDGWRSPSMRVWIDVAAINTFQELGLADRASRHLASCMDRIASLPLAHSWIVYNQALRLGAACALPLFQQSLRLFFGVAHHPGCLHAVDYLNRIGSCHEKMGDSDRACYLLTLGLQHYPGSASLLHARGLIHSDAGRTDDALTDMWAARALDPRSLSRYNAIIAVLGDAHRFDEMWALAERVAGFYGGLDACTDVCFLSMVVIAGTVKERFVEARCASDRMLALQAFLAPGDIEFVAMHRVRLFSGIWAAMQRVPAARTWLTATTSLMRSRRIVDLHRHLCDSMSELGVQSVDWAVSGDGCTALFWAAAECTDRPELIESLIINLNADVNFRNCSGRTALAYAIQNGHVRIAHTLVSLGADITGRDCFGRTPVSYLCDKALVQPMERALENGTREFAGRRQVTVDNVAMQLLSASGKRLDPNSLDLIVQFWGPTSSQVLAFHRESLIHLDGSGSCGRSHDELGSHDLYLSLHRLK